MIRTQQFFFVRNAIINNFSDPFLSRFGKKRNNLIPSLKRTTTLFDECKKIRTINDGDNCGFMCQKHPLYIRASIMKAKIIVITKIKMHSKDWSLEGRWDGEAGLIPSHVPFSEDVIDLYWPHLDRAAPEQGWG